MENNEHASVAALLISASQSLCQNSQTRRRRRRRGPEGPGAVSVGVVVVGVSLRPADYPQVN